MTRDEQRKRARAVLTVANSLLERAGDSPRCNNCPGRDQLVSEQTATVLTEISRGKPRVVKPPTD